MFADKENRCSVIDRPPVINSEKEDAEWDLKRAALEYAEKRHFSKKDELVVSLLNAAIKYWVVRK